MLTDIRALADQFLIAFPNINNKVFIPWFSLPPRLANVHVVEEATQAFRVSFNPIIVLKSREQSLKMRGDFTR